MIHRLVVNVGERHIIMTNRNVHRVLVRGSMPSEAKKILKI